MVRVDAYHVKRINNSVADHQDNAGVYLDKGFLVQNGVSPEHHWIP